MPQTALSQAWPGSTSEMPVQLLRKERVATKSPSFCPRFKLASSPTSRVRPWTAGLGGWGMWGWENLRRAQEGWGSVRFHLLLSTTTTAFSTVFLYTSLNISYFLWRWFAAVFKIHPWFHASVRNKCSRSYWGVQTRGSNKRLLYTGRTVCPLVVIFVYYVTQVTDGRHSEYNQGLISITKQVNVNNDINNEQEL